MAVNHDKMMNGDLVDYNGKHCRVIGTNAFHHILLVEELDTGERHLPDAENVYPIPLTEEILRQFEETGMFRLEYRKALTHHGYNVIVECNGFNTNGSFINVNKVEYVHELQHILLVSDYDVQIKL